jgi:hypothetical protein
MAKALQVFAAMGSAHVQRLNVIDVRRWRTRAFRSE